MVFSLLKRPKKHILKYLLPPVRKSAVLAGDKIPMFGRLGNTHLDILPFFPSDF